MQILEGNRPVIFLHLSANNGLVSRAIRWVTFSKFGHVDFLLPDGTLLGSHVTSGQGVQIRPYGYLDFTRILVLAVEAPAFVIEAAKSQIGRPFDFTAFINFGVQRDWQEPDSWFCAELVAWAFKQAGNDLFAPDADVWRITPRDLTITPLAYKIYEGEPLPVGNLLQLCRTALPAR